ncbi:MAG TPA: dienelactone hydrolase family protein [Allosphingosinicella sp.]|nr:dienelactone hydrolase family protein [Allosphingosinicella sp.]
MCSKEEGCGPDEMRRAFLAGSVGLAVTGMAGAALAQPPVPAAAPPPTRVLDDPGAVHGPVTFTHNGQPGIGGYLARPRAEGTYPAVLVIAGNRISEEYIPNTCAALALAGYVGLAPDIFHIIPASAQTLPEMRAAGANHNDGDVVGDVQAGIEYLRGQPFVRRGGIGALGFCYGGRIAMLLGARSREVDAVVAYHPGPVTQEEIARLSVPVQIHCGTADGNVPLAQIRALEAMLTAQRTPVEVHLYEGADHGFLAYTRPPRYDPAAGALSWQRTIAFLAGKLR